jgi:hypothetical protein
MTDRYTDPTSLPSFSEIEKFGAELGGFPVFIST